MAERSEWTDERLDDHMMALRALPAEVAKLAVRMDRTAEDAGECLRLIEKLGDSDSDRDRRIHNRIDELVMEMNARDRDYRRQVIFAFAPILIVAFAIAAKLVFGVDIPHP